MNEQLKIKIRDKNTKLINMVIERAKRDFPEDIAIIGLTGSFSTNDFHEKSDLDLIIINNTDRGWEISSCFILDDVGYDIYCTPWETRIEAQANLEDSHISCLIDLQILYYAKPEYLERFNAYRKRALDILALPIGKSCLDRAEKWINLAKQEYANILLAKDLGDVRYGSARLVSHLLNSLTSMNNTYMKRGTKRYLEEIASYRFLPKDFDNRYFSVIKAQTIKEIQNSSFLFLSCINDLYNDMVDQFIEKPVPTYDNLEGTYEELWCNYRNKIINSVELKDVSYAFHVAQGAQEFLDEMTKDMGTPKFDLTKYFNPSHLDVFQKEFLKIMDDYLKEYRKVGRAVNKYDSFDQLYSEYMG
jgi:hypothetical protein